MQAPGCEAARVPAVWLPMTRWVPLLLVLSSAAHAFEVLYLGAGTVELERDADTPPLELARCHSTGDQNLGPPDFEVNHFDIDCSTGALVTQPRTGRWAATMSVGAQTESYMPQNVKFFLNEVALGSLPHGSTLILWGTRASLDGWVIHRPDVTTFQTVVPIGFDEAGQSLYLDQIDSGHGAVWKVELGSPALRRLVPNHTSTATPLAFQADFIDERALRGTTPVLPDGATRYGYLRLDARRLLYYQDAPKLPVPPEARSTGYDHETYCDPEKAPSSWHVFDLTSGADVKVLDDDACRASGPFSIDGLRVVRDGWALLRQPRKDRSIVTWAVDAATGNARRFSDDLATAYDVAGPNLLACRWGGCGVFDRSLQLLQKVSFSKRRHPQAKVDSARLLSSAATVQAPVVDLSSLFAAAPRSALHVGPPGNAERRTVLSTLPDESLWTWLDGAAPDERGLVLEVRSRPSRRKALRDGESVEVPLAAGSLRLLQVGPDGARDADAVTSGTVRYTRVGAQVTVRIDATLRSGARLDGWTATVDANGY